MAEMTEKAEKVEKTEKTEMTEMAERPTFRINNRVYLSAGVLFYTIDENDTIHFMLQKVKGHTWLYEDFGGKSHLGDLSIKDVAFRECSEELNHAGGITKEYLETCKYIEYLVPSNKYVSYIIHIPFINADIFGNYEITCNVERTIVWLSYAELWNLHPSLIHPRLQPDFKNWLPLLITESEDLIDQ